MMWRSGRRQVKSRCPVPLSSFLGPLVNMDWLTAVVVGVVFFLWFRQRRKRAWFAAPSRRSGGAARRRGRAQSGGWF